MTGDCHVRFQESGRGRFPPATHQALSDGNGLVFPSPTTGRALTNEAFPKLVRETEAFWQQFLGPLRDRGLTPFGA